MAAVVDEKTRTPSAEKELYDDEKAIGGHIPDVAVLESDIQALSADIEEALQQAVNLTEEDVTDAARTILSDHENDPNFSPAVLELAHRFLDADFKANQPDEYEKIYQEMRVEAAIMVYNSPYAEVRAVVDNHDDPTIPASTVRAWIVGLIFVGAGSFINQFFSIRYPGISVGSNVAQLLAYPAGKALDTLLPAWTFNAFGHEISLNPGPFNMKEHMVITIMANVGFGAPYTNYVVFVQYVPRFFNMPWAKDFGYQILIGLSTNFIGYGLAGLTRRFLVYPPQAIWYANLATIALNRAFHSGVNEPANGWKVSRMRYFLYCFIGMFVYFWFPNYIFSALSFFNWMVWIDPHNVNLAAITGSTGNSGLGLNPLSTFDINQFYSDPWINPFYSTMNWAAGAFITMPIICALWYNNVWNTGYLPINNNYVWDNTGKRYKVAAIIDDNGLFDLEKYKAYSPAYLSAANLLVYGIFFAAYAATVSHAFLYHRREIAKGFRSILSRTGGLASQKDIHSRLMMSYKEVPEWWYFATLVVSIALGAAGVGAWPTTTTPAVVLYGVFLALIFCVPIGIILSTTNVSITLNVLAEFIGGAWFEGNALAMNFFKSYGYVTTAHTLNFAQDLKLAHYTHIPPRVTFFAQMVATLVSTFVAVGIMNYQLTIDNVCESDQKDHFICPGINTFFTASVLWGTLGPKKMFGVGAIYSGLVYCFLIGFTLPIVVWFAQKRFPALKSVHLPVLFTGGLVWSPYGLGNVIPMLPVAWFFNVYVKRRYLAWWSKYNYITTSAFTCGIAISAIVCYFALNYSDIELDWVGNSKPFDDNCDALKCPRLKIDPAIGHFGPGVGEFA
ncbi:OPT oligopeptide transporter [Auriculariales sp. MPI-PUGE-AT-0066]|nr:OPT oligopeptide transporter [Auriculariales sp. MPI-PUGE-AT-0066]